MSCAKLEEKIALYAGGDLSPQDTGQVEDHLAACSSCRELAEALAENRAAFRDLRGEELSPAVFQAVRHRVLSEIGERPQPQTWRWAIAFAGVVAVVAFLWRAPDVEAPLPGRPQIAQVSLKLPSRDRQGAVKPRAVTRVAKALSPVPQEPKPEPLMVKLITDDPDVVIYWLVGSNGDSL
jgi:anti-sigma factor RsiW